MSFDRAGWKTRARRTATGARCGRWANARAAMPVRRGGDGRRRLFAEALPAVESFRSPRAWAFTLLGLDAYCAAVPRRSARRATCRHLLADRLMSILSSVETPDWVWFEEGLAYDNARLPQALIVTGLATRTPAYVEAGLRSLRWLMTLQTTPTGHLPARRHAELRRDAQATAARSISSRWKPPRRSPPAWPRGARTAMPSGRPIAARAFAWFLGGNDLSVAAGRSRNRQLPRWPASRPRQREPRRRIGRVLSARPGRDAPARARATSIATKPAAASRRRRLSRSVHTSSEPRAPCHKPHF